MSKNGSDNEVIHHDDLYEDHDDDLIGDLEHLLAGDENDDDSAVQQNTIRIRFTASLNGYRRGDEVTVDAADKFFVGLIKQKLVEVL